MADATFVVALLLRFFHIVFGVLWIGAVAYGVGVLRRVMPRVEPPARKAVMRRLIPVLVHYVPGSAAMTILTGALLYGVLAGFDPSVLFGSGWGLVLLASLVLAVTAFATGMLFGVRTAKEMLVHMEEASCTHQAEFGGLQSTFNRTHFVVLGFGFAIIALMVIATTRALG